MSQRTCNRCRHEKPISDFSPIKRKQKDRQVGELALQCRSCAANKASQRRKKATADAETPFRLHGTSVLSIQDLLEQLRQLQPATRSPTSPWDLEVQVLVSDSLAESETASQEGEEGSGLML